jgi:phosphoesterase RecJ-like protein
VDVGELAKRLGGGGHKRAAGATVNESVESIRNRLILLVKELLR